MKIVFMGTPEFSVRILEALEEKYEVVLVVTQPDKEVGRKKILTPCPVKQKALELGIEVFQPSKIKLDYQRILDMNADIIITAAYGQIIPDDLINHHKFALNVHASLLPKYRGAAPIQRAIINGDKKTGVSIISMISKMDAGVVYATGEIDIEDSDTNTILFEKLSIIGKNLLLETLDDIYCGKIKGVEQDESQVVFAPMIKREEEKIDFTDTSVNIFNKIRGLCNEPGAYGVINDFIIKIYSSKILEYSGNEIPGSIIEMKKRLIVKTKDGALELIDIKPFGKQMMKSRDFLNGQKVFKLNDIFS